MRADAAVVFAAVRQSALALQQACEASRERKSIVLAATRQNGHALLYAREALRGDRDVVVLETATLWRTPGKL